MDHIDSRPETGQERWHCFDLRVSEEPDDDLMWKLIAPEDLLIQSYGAATPGEILLFIVETQHGVTLSEAIERGIAQARLLGLEVLEVRGEEWASVDDIAWRMGFSVAYVEALRNDLLGPGGFPVGTLVGETNDYVWTEVVDWFEQHFGPELAQRYDRTIAQANLALSGRTTE